MDPCDGVLLIARTFSVLPQKRRTFWLSFFRRTFIERRCSFTAIAEIFSRNAVLTEDFHWTEGLFLRPSHRLPGNLLVGVLLTC